MKRRRVQQFPRVPASVSKARVWLIAQLAQVTPAPDDQLVDDALLGLSEIATNAVEHGAGQRFTVACTVLDDMVTIEALDGGVVGSKLPTVQGTPDVTEERSRGLFIVNEISDGDWAWDTLHAGRMRVWFRLKLVQRVAV